jgi:hypothetical protein
MVNHGLTCARGGNDQAGRHGHAQHVCAWLQRLVRHCLLAQRLPVRVKIETVPKGVSFISGLTASVVIKPRN